MSQQPYLLVTIDTEADNQWSPTPTSTTHNARFLPRFQELCERYGFRPTYLTDYRMASCPTFKEFAADLLRRGVGEIGMHLHAWDSPPHFPLTEDDARYHPYLIEYPEEVIEEKVRFLTALLEDTYGTRMVSHRAGRWGLDRTYVRALLRHGYRVDCSVTPHVSWRAHRGDPKGQGGPDYRTFPTRPYYLDPDDIRRPGASPLLELPMTILRGRFVGAFLRSRAEPLPVRVRAGVEWLFSPLWFRPRGRNLRQLLHILHWGVRAKQPYLQFMLHSSELMPGGSPRFPTGRSIEALYANLEQLFAAARDRCRAATLGEYYATASAARQAPAPAGRSR